MRLMVYRNIVGRFIKFAIVGGSGALIQLAITSFLFDKYAPKNNELAFMIGIASIFFITSVWNFTFNSLWTFRGKRGEK